MLNSFSPQDTECVGCVFRQGKCILDKDNYYNNLGIKIEKPFPNTVILKDFICPYFRNRKWLKNEFDITKEEFEKDPSKYGYRSQIEIENYIPYYCILLHPTLEECEKMAHNINLWGPFPKTIYVVVKDKPQEYLTLVNDIFNLPLKNYGTHYLDRPKVEVVRELVDNAWFQIFQSCNRLEFMALIHKFEELPISWILDISNKIQDNLLKFSYVTNKNETFELIPAYMYNSYYFEYTKNWLTKLKEERWQQKYII